MRKALVAASVLSLLAGTALADDCAMAIPPVDKQGVYDFGPGTKIPVDQCKKYGHPLYYREKGAPGLLHLRLMPTKKSEWVGKVE